MIVEIYNLVSKMWATMPVDTGRIKQIIKDGYAFMKKEKKRGASIIHTTNQQIIASDTPAYATVDLLPCVPPLISTNDGKPGTFATTSATNRIIAASLSVAAFVSQIDGKRFSNLLELSFMLREAQTSNALLNALDFKRDGKNVCGCWGNLFGRTTSINPDILTPIEQVCVLHIIYLNIDVGMLWVLVDIELDIESDIALHYSISIFTSFNQSDKLRILLFFFPVFFFLKKTHRPNN